MDIHEGTRIEKKTTTPWEIGQEGQVKNLPQQTKV